MRKMLETTVEYITPQDAEKMLSGNTHNRPLRKGLAERYATEMVNGQWELTHQGIAFNCDGTLLDGQHRLWAIVMSGEAQWMAVARGVPSRAQLVVDTHAKRNAGDCLTLEKGRKITNFDIAVIRGAIEIQMGVKLSNVELDEVADAFLSSLEFVRPFAATKQRGITSAPVWSAVALAWFYVESLERLDAFCRVVVGWDMPIVAEDKAAVLLREWLLRTGVVGGRQRSDAFRKTQRAISAFMAQECPTRLYASSIYYPWPIDRERQVRGGNTTSNKVVS